LDGSGSIDDNHDKISFFWTYIEVPEGSSAELDLTDPVYPTFTADTAGRYQVQLTVDDGKEKSTAAAVTVTVAASETGTSIEENAFLEFFYTEAGNDYVLYVTGKKPHIVSVQAAFHGDNMSTDADSPVTLLLNGKETKRIARFTPIDTGQTYKFYLDTYYYTYGSVNADHDDTYIYDLPYDAGKSYIISQGYNSTYSHFGEFAYSLDFNITDGDPFYAARSGYVVQVVEEFSEAGTDESFKEKTNHLLIAHNDGTWAQYAHSPKDGIVVEVGDFIKKGQLIAYVGNTGYSTAPHLHFGVHKPESINQGTTSTVPTTFRTVGEIGITLQEGSTYTAGQSLF